MEKIAITDIVIHERIRKEYGDIEELASSFSRLGQLQPVILSEDNILLAGGRRMAAAVHLGWREIGFIRLADADEVARKEIELEENLRRKDLTWPEEVKAIRDLYNLKIEKLGRSQGKGKQVGIKELLAEDDTYNVRSLANETGRALGTVSMDIQLANGLDEYPELADEKSKISAFKHYKSLQENKLREELARRDRERDRSEPIAAHELIGGLEDGEAQIVEDSPNAVEAQPTTGDNSLPPRPVRQQIKKATWRGHGMLYHADSRDILRLLPDASIDCIVTDPPFGLGMFKEGSTTGGKRLAENAGEMYDDDPQAIMDMLDEVMMHCARLLKHDGHAYVFFHMTRYEEVYRMLRSHFKTCEETPLIWAKNTPGIGDPNRSWVYSYEPCFFVNRGRSLVRPQAFNVLRYDTVQKKDHPTEKPPQLLRHIISASCVQGEVVLEPFAGSGSTIIAALQLNCRFIAIEKNEKFYRHAAERIAQALAGPEEDAKTVEASPERADGEESRSV